MFLFLHSHSSIHLLLEECAVKSKLVTRYNYLQQNIWASLMNLILFHYQFIVFTFSNIKWINSKSSYCALLLLSVDISLNQGPKNNLQLLDSNEWNVFKSKRLHLIHLNINNFLSKFDELGYNTNFSNVAVIGLYESKLGEFVLQSEIQIKNYDLLFFWDRNRNNGVVSCHVRSDISYIQKQYVSEEIKNTFFDFIDRLPKLTFLIF